ncbi:MAG: uroporphyrinogen-III C-methyltransferase [Rhodoferax sp.]|nr:uroporphyrinogen-III C-methyltransferase [Rhodoferax sp.]
MTQDDANNPTTATTGVAPAPAPAAAMQSPRDDGPAPRPAAEPVPLPTLRYSPLAMAALMLAAVALAGAVMVWQRLSATQEQLARQSGESAMHAAEARASAKAAQDLSRETAARLAVAEVRLSEVAVQRNQLEGLIQSISRSRDENLVVDIESAVRLAQQQAQLTGSVEPLVAALQSADQRVARAAQPGLAKLQRALARDISRITASSYTDTPSLLARIDELLRMSDELPLANAVAGVSAGGSLKRPDAPLAPEWWQRVLAVVGEEASKLLRVSRVEQPEAVLLSPEQSFFVRENYKLKLLNARLGLLARQLESARADMASASTTLFRYFDPASRKTQAAANLLQQVQAQMKNLELPRVDDTLAALSAAAAGR